MTARRSRVTGSEVGAGRCAFGSGRQGRNRLTEHCSFSTFVFLVARLTSEHVQSFTLCTGISNNMYGENNTAREMVISRQPHLPIFSPVAPPAISHPVTPAGPAPPPPTPPVPSPPTANRSSSSFENPPSNGARSCVASSTTRGTICSPSGCEAAAFRASYQREAQRHQTQGGEVVVCEVETEDGADWRRRGKRGQRSLPRPVPGKTFSAMVSGRHDLRRWEEERGKGCSLLLKSRKVGVTTAATVCEPRS